MKVTHKWTCMPYFVNDNNDYVNVNKWQEVKKKKKKNWLVILFSPRMYFYCTALYGAWYLLPQDTLLNLYTYYGI